MDIENTGCSPAIEVAQNAAEKDTISATISNR
eukprot:CAMPEP_0198647258 /NCGR_PEP_ID=MMETSP1467-20131203/2575_1 /TAXON_ID=1462469 /ORGANISM="unid. sp., Strain CCMP2135" /LENGTH=31 /DNA_ID= /DNA_START= /DNA_END= /DNA_ORIENTATION=